MTTQTVDDFIQARLDEVSTAPSDALAEGGSWPPTTKRTYVAGWRNFTAWCLEHRRADLGVKTTNRPHTSSILALCWSTERAGPPLGRVMLA